MVFGLFLLRVTTVHDISPARIVLDEGRYRRLIDLRWRRLDNTHVDPADVFDLLLVIDAIARRAPHFLLIENH